MVHKKEPNPWRYAGIGLELGGVVAVMAFLGHAFDQWQGTKPWGLLTGACLGIVGGLYNLIKATILDQKKEERDRAERDK